MDTYVYGCIYSMHVNIICIWCMYICRYVYVFYSMYYIMYIYYIQYIYIICIIIIIIILVCIYPYQHSLIDCVELTFLNSIEKLKQNTQFTPSSI